MELIEIDPIDLQASQRVFAFAPDGLGSENPLRLRQSILRIPNQPALREDVGPVIRAFPAKKPSDDFFGMAEPVDRRGVDPVDADLDGVIHRRNRLVVVLRTPGKRPAATSYRPGAEADAGDVHVCRPQLPHGK